MWKNIYYNAIRFKSLTRGLCLTYWNWSLRMTWDFCFQECPFGNLGLISTHPYGTFRIKSLESWQQDQWILHNHRIFFVSCRWSQVFREVWLTLYYRYHHNTPYNFRWPWSSTWNSLNFLLNWTKYHPIQTKPGIWVHRTGSSKDIHDYHLGYQAVVQQCWLFLEAS